MSRWASIVVIPSGVAIVNPPRSDGATLSAWGSPDATDSPLAAIHTSSSLESSWPYKAFNARAVPATSSSHRE